MEPAWDGNIGQLKTLIVLYWKSSIGEIVFSNGSLAIVSSLPLYWCPILLASTDFINSNYHKSNSMQNIGSNKLINNAHIGSHYKILLKLLFMKEQHLSVSTSVIYLPPSCHFLLYHCVDYYNWSEHFKYTELMLCFEEWKTLNYFDKSKITNVKWQHSTPHRSKVSIPIPFPCLFFLFPYST